MVYLVKKNYKWTNARQSEYNGSRYDSGFEAEVARDLDFQLKAGEIKSWERQVKLSLDVNDHHICNYYIDFVVYHNDGDVEYLEAKGWSSPVFKLKWKLFEALYTKPGNRLTIIKQNTSWALNKMRRGKK